MSRDIDSDALTTMNRLLGIAGRGSSQTELDDGNLSQVIDVNPIVRRSRTPVGSTGFYICTLTNVHSAADNETSQIDPYLPGASVAPAGGYPASVDLSFDVWIAGMSIARIAGAGQLDGGQVDLTTGSSTVFSGWGQDDAGDPDISTIGTIITQFAVMNTGAAGGNSFAAEVGSGLLASRALVRVRRGLQIRFHSTADAAATFRLVLNIGLFPAGLGQDIVT